MSINRWQVRTSDLSEPGEQPVSKARANASQTIGAANKAAERTTHMSLKTGHELNDGAFTSSIARPIKRKRLAPKHSKGRYLSPTPDGLHDALELTLEKLTQLRGKTDREEAVTAGGWQKKVRDS